MSYMTHQMALAIRFLTSAQLLPNFVNGTANLFDRLDDLVVVDAELESPVMNFRGLREVDVSALSGFFFLCL